MLPVAARCPQRGVATEVGDLRPILAAADPVLNAEVYADLGIAMVHRPADDVMAVAALPHRLVEARRAEWG